MVAEGGKPAGAPSQPQPQPQQVEGAFFRGGSSIFRAVNFELFAKGNKAVAVFGSFLFLCSVGLIANMTPQTKTTKKKD